jgi:hypothetical protein
MQIRRIAISGIRALAYATHYTNASYPLHYPDYTTDQNLRLYPDINRKFQGGHHRRAYQKPRSNEVGLYCLIL